jgi:hypothetical protein
VYLFNVKEAVAVEVVAVGLHLHLAEVALQVALAPEAVQERLHKDLLP